VSCWFYAILLCLFLPFGIVLLNIDINHFAINYIASVSVSKRTLIEIWVTFIPVKLIISKGKVYYFEAPISHAYATLISSHRWLQLIKLTILTAIVQGHCFTYNLFISLIIIIEKQVVNECRQLWYKVLQ